MTKLKVWQLKVVRSCSVSALLWKQRQAAASRAKRRAKTKHKAASLSETTNSQQHERALSKLLQRLDVMAQRFPAGFFVKLNTRSGKDAPIYGFRNAEMRATLQAELRALEAAGKRDDNTETLVGVL